ncbi:MAG: 50S ribosomal protein L25 [Ktedonobacteraceae bacterium]|nr:50S ribosomal protein L25 [Ktedonobacteraceae bacterium]
MAQQTELTVAPRTIMGKAVKRLRAKGLIPANIYGHKEPPVAVQVDAMTFDRLARTRETRNVLVLRLVDGATQTALVRNVQRDPRTDKVLHIDFTRVSLEETIISKIPLRFVGVAPGVKEKGGVLLHLMDTLEVESRVSDLVEHLDVDVSSLADIDDVLHAGDIPLPAGYTLRANAEEPVVKIEPPRIEAVEEAAEAAEGAEATGTAPGQTAAGE